MTLTELQKEIYSINKANGWHDKVPSKLEQHALFHTEITEAYNELIVGRLETWYQEDGKPEGFYTELADVVIRILDYFSLDNLTYSSEQPLLEIVPDNEIGMILFAHETISLATEYVRTNKQTYEMIELTKLIYTIQVYLALRHQEHLSYHIKEKIAYNKTRGHRHGGKVI